MPLQDLLHLLGGSAVGQTVNDLFEGLREGLAEGRPRGGRQRSEGGPVVCGVEREHAGAAAVQAAGLQRDLHRVGAGDGEVDPGVGERRERTEALGQLEASRVGMDVAQSVDELFRLLPDRRDHGRVAVADGRDTETGGEVDVAVSVDVDHVAAQGFGPEHRGRSGNERVDPRGLGGLEPSGHGPGPGPGRRGQDLRQQAAALEPLRAHFRQAFAIRSQMRSSAPWSR